MRIVLPLVLLSVSLLGCSRSAAPRITTPTAAQIAEFTRNASIVLPATAQPVGWREERGMDDALWLQVRMPVADLPDFLDRSPFRTARFATNNPYEIFHFRDFIATPPDRYRTGDQELPNARFLRLLIDDSDGTNAVVYLMWHEM